MGKKTVLLNETLHILDPEGKTIISLDTGTKQAKQLAVNVDGMRDFSAQRSAFSVLHSNGVSVVQSPSAEVTGVIEKNDDWQDPVLMRKFGENLYIFDRAARRLWKYAAAASGYEKPYSWIQSPQGLDASRVYDMAIDGRVWLTTDDGKILVYSQGSKSAFSVKNLAVPFSESLLIFTSADHEFVYFLEPSSQRLVTLGKSGEFEQVVYAKELAAASSFVVREDVKKAYVVAGSIVYEVQL